MEHFYGIYLITPFSRYELTVEACPLYERESETETGKFSLKHYKDKGS